MGLGLPLGVAESSLETSLKRERFLESLDAYQRGLSDAPLLRKWSAGGAGVTAEAGATGENAANEMTFVISTDDVDRHGDVIIPEGWVLGAYQLNPVFLSLICFTMRSCFFVTYCIRPFPIMPKLSPLCLWKSEMCLNCVVSDGLNLLCFGKGQPLFILTLFL